MTKYIKTGNKIEVIRISDRNADTSYVSQVEEVIGAKTISAHVPISFGHLLRLPLKLRYRFIFHTERGMIAFEGTITSYFKEENMYLMKISLASAGELVQRREFFRFTCFLPVKFCEVGDSRELILDEMYDGVTRDISGGGIRFASNDNVDESKKIRCVIEMGNDLLIVVGDVLQKQYVKESNYHFQYRLEYTGILEADQEKIVRYIFNEQRQQLRIIK